MKTVCFLLIFLNALHLIPALHAEVSVIPVDPSSEALFKWLKRGELYYVYFTDTGEGGYLYRSEQGDLEMMDKLQDFESMLANQGFSDEQLRQFLHADLPYVALSFFSPSQSYIITKEYMRNRQSIPVGAWRDLGLDSLETSKEILNKYLSELGVIKDDNKWEIVFYVTMKDGSISKWHFVGEYKPFFLMSLNINLVEPPGSIEPLPAIGGI